MKKNIKSFYRSSILTSLFLIVLGFLLIFKSETTIVTISYIIGAILIAAGVLAILRFFNNKDVLPMSELDILYGIVTAILGMLVITYPHTIASVIPVILGIAIIISSASKLQYAFDLKANNNELWKGTMAVAIISTICGVVLLFNPFKGAVVITMLVGIFIIVYALLDIVSTLVIKKNIEEFKNVISEETKEAEVVDEKETIVSEAEVIEPKKKKTTKKEKKK